MNPNLHEPACDKCGRELKRSSSIGGGYLGAICRKCLKLYCVECMPPIPDKCPDCGNATNYAFASALRDLTKAREGVGGTASTPSIQGSHPTPKAKEEHELEHLLPRLESKLKALSNPSLPLEGLTIETRFGSPKLAWCFATTYGVPLDVRAAESFLNNELNPHGITVTDGGYMGSGQGTPSLRRTNLFLYTRLPQETTPELLGADKKVETVSRKPVSEGSLAKHRWWTFWR